MPMLSGRFLDASTGDCRCKTIPSIAVSPNMVCVKGFVSGRVQGVGFRYFVSRHADESKVCGFARNLRDGRVEFLLQGETASVQSVLENIRKGPSFSLVTGVELVECECQDIENRFLTL